MKNIRINLRLGFNQNFTMRQDSKIELLVLGKAVGLFGDYDKKLTRSIINSFDIAYPSDLHLFIREGVEEGYEKS